VQHLKVLQISAPLSGSDDSMRKPSDYEAPLCAQVGGNFWFPDREDQDSASLHHIAFAKSICQQCIHRTECAEWGIKYEKHGIWGGLSSFDRRRVRKKLNIILRGEQSA
jgi:hypothetical protein